jgi:hypothetical protein
MKLTSILIGLVASIPVYGPYQAAHEYEQYEVDPHYAAYQPQYDRVPQAQEWGLLKSVRRRFKHGYSKSSEEEYQLPDSDYSQVSEAYADPEQQYSVDESAISDEDYVGDEESIDTSRYQDELNRLPQSERWGFLARIFNLNAKPADQKKNKKEQKAKKTKKKATEENSNEEEEEKPRKGSKPAKFQGDEEYEDGEYAADFAHFQNELSRLPQSEQWNFLTRLFEPILRNKQQRKQRAAERKKQRELKKNSKKNKNSKPKETASESETAKTENSPKSNDSQFEDEQDYNEFAEYDDSDEFADFEDEDAED